MNNRHTLSVIVPVYNVRKYLKKCLDSILNQTYKDFDLIIVDDGSTDGCSEICNEYAEKYCNVLVIHKTNGGLSDARNEGVKASNAESVIFIDSDDYINCDLIENLISTKIRLNVDIVCSPLIYQYDRGKEKPNVVFNEFIANSDEAQVHILRGKCSGISACAKLLPKKILEKIPYPVGMINEELRTIIPHIRSAERIAFSPYAGYHYIQRNNSITYSQFNKERILETIDVCNNYMKTTDNISVKNACINRMYRMIIDYSKGQIRVSRKDIQEIQSVIRVYYNQAIEDKDNSAFEKIKFYLITKNVCSFWIFHFLQKINRLRYKI